MGTYSFNLQRFASVRFLSSSVVFLFAFSITSMTSSSSSNSANYDAPWVEKYRTNKVIDIVGNEDAVSRLQVIARDDNMPNLILSRNSYCEEQDQDVCPKESNKSCPSSRHKVVILDEADRCF